MRRVSVVTDSLADLPAEFVAELDITVVPCIVRFGERVYRDRVDLSSDELYERLINGPELPQTSGPPVGAFEEVYRHLGQKTDQILSIHIPARLSGTVSAALAARQALPHLRIEIVDSTNITMALGWLVVRAAQAAQAGQDMDQILAMVRKTIPRLRLLAALDTLEYAYRGGRIGKAKFIMGSLLKVKPILQILNSELLPVENVRTRGKALRRLVELIGEWGPLEDVAVIHAHAPHLAEELREMLADIHPPERIPITETGPVLGTHAGPGAVGIGCVLAADPKDRP